MDLPTTKQTTTATFMDDTTIMVSYSNPKIASRNLQENKPNTGMVKNLENQNKRTEISTCNICT